MVSSGIPHYLEQRILRQREQVPICYNLEISKFPLFMLCLFWKIQEMSADICGLLKSVLTRLQN